MLSTAEMTWADGILSQLPKDGSLARYDVHQTVTTGKGEKLTHNGTMTVSSVGQETVNGEVCRWIEIGLDSKAPENGAGGKHLMKVLIPEKHFNRTGNPLKYLVKGWFKSGDQEPKALPKVDLDRPSMFEVVLGHAPLQNTKALPAKTFTGKFGKLTCDGVGGTLTLKDAATTKKDGKTIKKDATVDVQTYSHATSPFGLVWWRIEGKYSEPGDVAAFEGSASLTEIGTGAKSVLPDHK